MSNRSKKAATTEADPSFWESCAEKWTKGVRRAARWDKETFEDFPVCVHWFRQIVAVIVGLTVGLMGIVGGPGLIGGFGTVMAITYVYYTHFVEADELSYGGNGLRMEGTMHSFAMFILAWTVGHTAVTQYADEVKEIPLL